MKDFYINRNKEKNEALGEILNICLKASNQENIFCIAQSGLDYIMAMEQLLKEYQSGHISDKAREDVEYRCKEYWDCAKQK